MTRRTPVVRASVDERELRKARLGVWELAGGDRSVSEGSFCRPILPSGDPSISSASASVSSSFARLLPLPCPVCLRRN
jgi:hypothetical protein